MVRHLLLSLGPNGIGPHRSVVWLAVGSGSIPMVELLLQAGVEFTSEACEDVEGSEPR